MGELANSKEKIIESALTLFASRGYDAVGVAEIVSAAGITKPTLYHYFGSKEGLFKALLDDRYPAMTEALKTASRYSPNPERYFDDVYPVLRGTAKVYFDFAKAETAFCLMAISMSFAPASSVAARLVEPYRAEQAGILEKMFYDISKIHGNLRGKEKNLAWYFIALVESRVGCWARGTASLDDIAAKDLTRQFMHGIFA
jgi:TetR/AcrR family transcriptional regulator